MRKYTSVVLFAITLFITLLGFNIDTAGAANCASGELFNTVTGQRCGTATTAVACPSGDVFHSVTGQRCTVVSGGGGSSGGSGAVATNLTIGSRGTQVRAVQQILKNEGYTIGTIDGNYGRRTARAIREFQDDNDLPITGIVDAATLAKLGTFGSGDTLAQANPPSPTECAASDFRTEYNEAAVNFSLANPGPNFTLVAAGNGQIGTNYKVCKIWVNYSVPARQLANGNFVGPGTMNGTTIGFGSQRTAADLGVQAVTNPNLVITTSSLPNARVGQPYFTSLGATGGTGLYGWNLGSSIFPSGLAFAISSSGITSITGTPTTSGTYTFTLTLTSGSQSLPKQFSLTVDPATSTFPSGCTSNQGYSSTTGASCGNSITPSITSYDSDGGKNYSVKGTTTGITKCVNQEQCTTPFTNVDVCWKDNHEGTTGNDNQLHEYFIGSDGYMYVEFYQSPTGCENGAIKSATNQPPTASITGSTDLTVGQTGTWNFSTADQDGNLSRWRFYDSNNQNPQWTPITGSSTYNGSYSASFSSPGIYYWKLDVEDSSGASAPRSFSVTVTDPTPTPTFPSGCSSNQGFSSTTGLSCGCTSTSGFSSYDGSSCGTTTPSITAPTTTILPSLSVSLDATTPISSAVTPGSINVEFARIKVSAGSQLVNNLNNIQVGSDSPNAGQMLQNLKVFDGATQIGNTAGVLSYNGSYYYAWISVSGVSIPAFSTKTFRVVADMNTSASGQIRAGIAGWNFSGAGANVTPFGTAIYGNNLTITAPTTNRPPTAIITGSTTLAVGQTGTWNFSATDQDGNLSKWRFYDSSNPNPQWTPITGSSTYNGSYSASFSTAGTYTWILDVKDLSMDASAATPISTSYSVYVTAPTVAPAPAPVNRPPTAIITGSTTLAVGQTGTWTFSAADQDGNLSKWRFYASTNENPQWSCTSGGLPPCNTVNSSASGTYSTSFPTAGTYTWKLEAEDSSGASAPIASYSVYVTASATTSLSACGSAVSQRGQNGSSFSCSCSSVGGTVWGSGPYTDDSNICTAAKHANLPIPGNVTYIIKPGQDSYTGSTQNGVTTNSYGVWGGSFSVTAGPTSMNNGQSNLAQVFDTGSLTANVLGGATNAGTTENVADTESFHFTQFLEQGSYGNEVMELQKFLNNAGYDVGKIDGNFGLRTKEALMKFQTKNGLKSDGIVGYEVRTFLNK